jgi:hypothetical protein
MARFIALPVAQGDAFYFESDESSVLVDGGRNRLAFATMFQRIIRSDGAKVVICTHNDADHASGILGFLENGMRCDELWLPGRWLSVLPSVLKPFVDVFVELADTIAQIPQSSVSEVQSPGLAPIEVYAEQLSEISGELRSDEEAAPVNEAGWPESYVSTLENAEPWEIWMMPWPWPDYHNYSLRLGPNGARLLWSAIEAATRIRCLAIEAFHRGISVHWFEFDTSMNSARRYNLQPLNARAVARVRPVVGSLLQSLALTVSNKQSLVFWRHPTGDHPGILFTADSDLAGIMLPKQLDGAIVTAPHHGSEANANAYRAVRAANPQNAVSITWVRSDGKYRSRPGPSFLNLSSRRVCTRCRNVASTEQPIRLFSRAGTWVRQRTKPCQCKPQS